MKTLLTLNLGDEVMAIDRIDWHWDSVTDASSEDEHLEKAGAHIGYFIEWAYKKGFAPTDSEIHDVDEYKEVIDSKKTGIQFFIENCDTKFWEEDLSEEGQKFAASAYDTYLADYEEVIGHKPFVKIYNQQDLQSVSKYLDEKYSDYLQMS